MTLQRLDSHSRQSHDKSFLKEFIKEKARPYHSQGGCKLESLKLSRYVCSGDKALREKPLEKVCFGPYRKMQGYFGNFEKFEMVFSVISICLNEIANLCGYGRSSRHIFTEILPSCRQRPNSPLASVQKKDPRIHGSFQKFPSLGGMDPSARSIPVSLFLSLPTMSLISSLIQRTNASSGISRF